MYELLGGNMTDQKLKRSHNTNFLTKKKQVAYVAIPTVTLALLTGCYGEKPELYLFDGEQSCKDNKVDAAECEAAYKKAVKEAQRTAEKFFEEQSCEIKYGVENCIATPDDKGFMPKMSSFIYAHVVNDRMADYYGFSYYWDKIYAQPLFSAVNQERKTEKKLLMLANGDAIGAEGDKSLQYDLPREYLRPFPTIKLGEVLVSENGYQEVVSVKKDEVHTGSMFNSLAAGYLISQLVDRHRYRDDHYRDDRYRNNSSSYSSNSGGYSGSYSSTSSNHRYKSSSTYSSKSSYSSKSTHSTSSRGGWGSTSSSRSSWGG